ncbi:A/G-specific adenine glycosylase [Fodinicurvata sediminis]|uniref:A/G-specific adenine glycosylase n=1 Tax=Fodinicurvata sediminis TaxID=1121832 RepID=UPI0003B427E5|nr:A/G-specific adenine glycosylase [Fodinicurvata sediminis]
MSSSTATESLSPAIAERIAGKLLAWYDRHARVLPWRAVPGQRPDAYHVWLSEIMLQQTTVAAVKPYFEAFLERWPTVADLAAADREDVLTAWAGLGYYARARNLHRCAQVVTDTHGGVFPETADKLQGLPGIGPYTAAAIAAIAFDQPEAPVDGNIERVISRLFAIETELPKAKPEIGAFMRRLVPVGRPGDFAQAMMDLGAGICQPARPRCMLCPLAEDCSGRARGIAETLPRKAARKEKPLRQGVAFWLIRPDDSAVLLRRRPERGLLGGMTEVPSTDWTQVPPDDGEALAQAPLATDWQALPGQVSHTFTHFRLQLRVWAARGHCDLPGGRWVTPEDLDNQALPSVMRKVIAHAIKQGWA